MKNNISNIIYFIVIKKYEKIVAWTEQYRLLVF